MGTREPELCIF